MGGRPPEHEDSEVLVLFVKSQDPALFTTEVAELLGMTSSGAFRRLEDLEDKGLVQGKTAKNARVWWLTWGGRELAAEAEETD